MDTELFRGGCCKLDAPILAVLRWLEYMSTFFRLRRRASYGERLGSDIEVLPPKSQKFAFARPIADSHDVQGFRTVAANGFWEGSSLSTLIEERPVRPRLLPRRVACRAK